MKAVEWLIEKLDDNLDVNHSWRTKQYIEQAKEMEKEQSERMYSEEDLREAFKESRQCKIFEKDMPPVHNEFEDWFEQFKKVGISKYFCECGSQKDQDCKYCTSCNSFNSI